MDMFTTVCNTLNNLGKWVLLLGTLSHSHQDCACLTIATNRKVEDTDKLGVGAGLEVFLRLRQFASCEVEIEERQAVSIDSGHDQQAIIRKSHAARVFLTHESPM